MRDKADRDGKDILLIDTGDRIEGNGLYDASDPRGLYTFDIFTKQDIDILCTGNHELYKANSSNDEYDITVPAYKDHYLASNIDIHDHKTGELRPLAQRYRKFITKNNGYRVIAFGFLFNFLGSSNNTVVTPVQDAIKQQWFQDAIRDRDVDIFVVTGHIGLRMEELNMIFTAIREVQWDVPIQILGGHTHIRDYVKYDGKAYGLESGRYMETVGFASVNFSKHSPSFNRRYIDNNLYSYYHHTGLNASTFPTELGQNVTEMITHARSALKLDLTHGCAPRTLYTNRAPITDKSSVFNWLQEEVFPDQYAETGPDARPTFVITNTGSVRFDVFEGLYTKDTNIIVSPFTTGFLRLSNLKYSIASRITEVLNAGGNILESIDPTLDSTALAPPRLGALESMRQSEGILMDPEDLSPGYTTVDDLGNDGDDTVHSRIQFFANPNAIQGMVNFPQDVSELDTVDVVYNSFIEPWLSVAIQFLGGTFDEANVTTTWDNQPMSVILADWVERNWPCEDKIATNDEL